MIHFRLALSVVALLIAVPVTAAEALHDIRDFGAKPGGEELCTAAIQKAVDRCAADGGGTVYFPPGVWLSGTIDLKSHVTLRLEAGATLRGSPKGEDYPERLPTLRSYTDNYVRQALIWGENLSDVAIVGRGTIDGNGAPFRWREYRGRPFVIRLVGCTRVRVEDLRLESSPMWMQHYLACEDVRIRGLTVFNHVSYNNDALDIDACRDVQVSDCTFDSDDDALCLKSTLDRPCENVVITNCILRSHCNALKCGTESHGGFRNITVTNCTIRSPHTKAIYGRDRGTGGISLETVDGGTLERVAISNIAIEGVAVPIFLRLGNRGRQVAPEGPKPGVAAFRDVTLSNIVADGASSIGCPITGIPGHRIERVQLSNIQIGFEGGGTRLQATREVPEHEAKYPEGTMFGPLPAYGFYCRHVDGVKFRDVRLHAAAADAREPIVRDDAENLVIEGLDARPGK